MNGRTSDFRLETEIIGAIGKAHDEFAIFEFDLRYIAFACEVRHSGFNMRKRDCLNRLSKRHIGLHNSLAIRHIKGMSQQEAWIKNNL